MPAGPNDVEQLTRYALALEIEEFASYRHFMNIDFLVPGSANDHFFSNIAFMRRSLDALGGDYAAARLVAALGEWKEP